jgi:tRNA (cytidine/uridine-2'-O-)-methyltransferase
MFHVVLYQPEIPPNTGNIIRLCANTGSHLHLIRPLGFDLDDRRLRRAGLDYRERANIRDYGSLQAFEESVRPSRLFAVSTRGRRLYTGVAYEVGDAFLFGPETRGLPAEVLQSLDGSSVLRIPMVGASRNAAAVIIYEAWRQLAFVDGAPLH